jgi:glutamate-1-semialdehyde 2,1-aminomutase (EC 5.4.3.8)
LVGGVNSPVRSFIYVGGEPIVIESGKGSKIKDIEGREYIDYICSWGAIIHGHANEYIENRIIEAVKRGNNFGLTTEFEVELAERICNMVKSIEKIRFVNSGTEATMSAIRLARAYTNRDLIIKFEGCYHGHSDHFLSKAGSGLATYDIPLSPGVPKGVVENTLTLPYNDEEKIEKAFEKAGNKIACVIIEPVAGNMGVVLPNLNFLRKIRKLCDEYGSLLIFDEVITGFRVSLGGAQELFGIYPDLTCLGKIIGGGLPVGAYGGKKEIMDLISPSGPVYQAGTLAGNPIVMVAGLAALELLTKETYESLEKKASYLEKGIYDIAEENGIDIKINRCGSMFSLFFTNKPVKNFNDAKNTKYELYKKIFWIMLKEGVLLPPSPFESIFLTTSHSDDDLENTLEAFHSAFHSIPHE